MGRYQTAQICLNGHISNDSMQTYPENNEKYYKECGARTITKCPNCKRSIRGALYTIKKEPPIPRLTKAPMYCIECGKPYPWTKSKLKAARELIQELENLTEEEKKVLDQSVNEIIKSTPETELWVCMDNLGMMQLSVIPPMGE